MADACLCKGIGIARTSKAKIEGISHAGFIDTGNIWFPICRSTATNVFKRFQTHETKRFEFKTHYGIPTRTKTLSREKRKSAQPSKPRPPHGWKCRTGAWLPPVRFHGSFTPSRPPAGSLAPLLYRGPACYAFGEDGSHSAPSPCSLFRHKEKRIADNQ